MGDEEGDSNNNKLEDFDFGNELSAIVASNKIPSRIADKIENTLIPGI